jgi:hypothetical protein
VALACGAALAGPARADGLIVVAESAVYCADAGEVRFTLTFSRAPDFSTLDEHGRQADSFQYYIHAPWSEPGLFDVLIRGEEIHVNGDLRVRDRHGDGGPDASGWGPLRGAAPFRQDGATLTWSLPLAWLADDDGAFHFEIDLAEYGVSSSDPLFRHSHVAVAGPDCLTVPVEALAWGGLKSLYR